ncbi:MAG: penicillin-binding transpeptidase domain-containing protein, partial [Minicystis sp.]
MSLFVQRSDVSEFRRRFRWIALGMALLFLGLIGRLFQLQIIDTEENRAIARENIVRRITLATTRGIIRDRTGKTLAASRPAYNVYIVPARLDMANVWPKLVDYLGVGLDERTRLEQHVLALRASDGKRKDQQILLKEDVSRDAVANLSTHEAELPGVEVVPVPVRYYPFDDVGAHVLGYMAEVDGDRLSTLRSSGYLEGDRIGVTGVERAWESYLRGTRGWEKVLVDARGRRKPGGDGIIEDPRRTDPIPGRDLRLTLDADVQKALDKAFRGELAGGVAMVDVRTGRILGLYSKPSFDPNAISGGSGKQVIRDAFRRLYSDPLKPALDKTVSGAYPPGSTFKPFTALAALEKGIIGPHVMTQCKGAITFGKRTFRCTHVHGATELHKAIAESCNVYFYTLAAEYGLKMDDISLMGNRYGLGSRTGLGVNAEASGRMPTKAWMTVHNGGHFQLGFGLNATIGQGATTVTVLQLALAYAALANGGTLY